MKRILIILCLLTTVVYGASTNLSNKDLEFNTGLGGTNEALMDFLYNDFLIAGTDISFDYDDSADTLTINSTASINADNVTVNGTDVTDPNLLD